MKTTKMLTILVLALGLMVWPVEVSEAAPMGTAFTYQGRLIDANSVAEGRYDFQFKLFDDPNVILGNQQGSVIDINDLDVFDGYFTVELNFGSSVFDGNPVWLQIDVRPGDSNDPNAFVSLSPRQEVTPTPYALQTRGIFVDKAENVGVGTTSPKGKLHVDGGKARLGRWGTDVTIKAQDGGDGGGFMGDDAGDGGDIILLPGEGGEPTGPGRRGRDGNVGIGTAKPTEKLDVVGNIDVSNYRVKSYHGFPRPDYDSGWQPVGRGQYLTLQHNIGGDPNHYVVDLQFKGGIGIHNKGHGGYSWDPGLAVPEEHHGGYWLRLTGTDIMVKRNADDKEIYWVRIRIWVYN